MSRQIRNSIFNLPEGSSSRSYWTTRYISALSVLTTSGTEQTITVTIVGTGYDGVSFEYSIDGTNFTEHGTSVNGTYNATGLSEATEYIWRARLYKGSSFGSYSDIAVDVTEPTILRHQTAGVNDVVADFDKDNVATITKGITNFVSRWNDALGSGHDLIQATGGSQPLLTDDEILFNGADNRLGFFNGSVNGMKTVNFTFNQPAFVFSVTRLTAWLNINVLYDGGSGDTLQLATRTSTPSIAAEAGAWSDLNSDLVIGSYSIIRLRVSGINSKLQVDEGVAITGNFGSGNPGGFSLNRYGGSDIAHARAGSKRIIVLKVNPSSGDEAAMLNYLKKKYFYPKELEITVLSPTKINLAWKDCGGDNDSYKIERSTDRINYSVIDTIAARSKVYSDATVSANTKYYYRIRTLKGVDYSRYSNIISGTTSARVVSGVCLVFDDNTNVENFQPNAPGISQDYAQTVLGKYEWKATLAFNTNSINTTNQQDIDEVTAAKTKLDITTVLGHELGNHTIRHQSFGQYLAAGHTRQEYYDNYIVPLQTIFNGLWGSVPTSFIYSNWAGSDAAMGNLILANGFSIVREGITAIPENLGDVCYNGTSQIVLGLDIANTLTSDVDVLRLLDYARVNNVIVVLYGHTLTTIGTGVDYEVKISRVKTICNYIVNNHMTFYKLSELQPSLFI